MTALRLKRTARVERKPGSFAWYLAGPHGIVQFVAGRTWIGVDVGYHSSCPLFDGVTCYYDGSSLAAEDLLRRWVSAGCDDEVIWAYLTERYLSWLADDQEVAL